MHTELFLLLGGLISTITALTALCGVAIPEKVLVPVRCDRDGSRRRQ